MAKQRFGLGIVGVLLGALAVAWAGISIGGAQEQAQVGHVSVEALWELALRPALQPPLEAETMRLQAELDARVEGKSDEERQALFEYYQSLLYSRQQKLIDAMLVYVSQVIGQVAVDLKVTTVVDQQIVLYGGVNMTAAVLDAIDKDELAAIAERVLAEERAKENAEQEDEDSDTILLGF